MKRVFTIPDRTHGSGPVFFTWQRQHSKYLITTGYDNVLNIFNRHGDKEDQINLPGLCTGLAWDYDGEHIGIITDRSPIIILWDASLRKTTRVDTGVRDVLSIILWAKKSQILAVGTSKGNVLIYDHRTARKIPILGKHTKRICSGAWSENNLLALVGEERVLSINSEEGDTICEISIKGDASLLKFVNMKMDDANKQQSHQENCVALVLNKKSLLLVSVHDNENVHPLNFDENYGLIVDYFPYQESYVIIGFTNGLFMLISSSIKDLGNELKSFQIFKDSIQHFAICKGNKKLAVCNDNVIKVYETQDLEDVKSMITVDDEKSIDWMEWSDDGQLLSIASQSGAVHVYLTKLNIIGSTNQTKLAYLSSLLEVTIVNVVEDAADAVTIIRVDIEPSIVAVGPDHLAIAMNNRCWFYQFNQQILIKEKEYLAIIKCIELNADYCAILFTDGQCFLHLIDSPAASSSDQLNESKIFQNQLITSIILTNQLFIYATDQGSIEFFLIEDWTMVNVYRHQCGIRQIAVDLNGLRLILVDDRNDVYLYNSIIDQVYQIESIESSSIKKILWESFHPDKYIFTLIDAKFIYVYSFLNDTIEGPVINYVGKEKLVSGQYPLLLYNGIIICQTDSGKTSNFILSTHQSTELITLMQLMKYSDAIKLCSQLAQFQQLAEHSLTTFNLDAAIKVYKQLNEIGLIISLTQLKTVEERNLLAGHLAMILRRYDLAQSLYLQSSQPFEALEMRQSIHDWDQALILAKRLNPKLIPIISREFANQLEFSGDYQSSLQHYQSAIVDELDTRDGDGDARVKHHNELCEAGIARNSLRIGNVRKGLEMLMKMNSNQKLLIECGQILEQLKLYSDAASLYEKSSSHRKAIELYLKLKQMKKVEQLINHIDLSDESNYELIAKYAKYKEAESDYREAIKAYKSIGDNQSAIKLLLDKLNEPNQAIQIYKQTRSLDDAKLIARFFQRINSISSAIEFLVLSANYDEAFKLASSTGQMDIYANLLLEQQNEAANNNSGGSNHLVDSDYNSIAIYYEQEKNILMAGKFNCLNESNLKKGVKQLIQASQLNKSDSDEAIRLAINAISKYPDQSCQRLLIDYLLGELDGQPKDFKYLFRLYMKLGQFKDAAKISLIIANEQQNVGQYRNAHQLLFSMYQELKKQSIQVPSDIIQHLLLIHSYLLIKVWIKLNDAIKSSQLLIRCCSNLSKFPQHSTQILTTAIFQCLKAGFKSYAYQYAKQLIQLKDYEAKVDQKYKRKIEQFIRKSAKDEDVLEEDMINIGLLTPCPYCGHQTLETELTCLNCRQLIDFCSATAFHLIKDEVIKCPNCEFPANQKAYQLIQRELGTCQMCLMNIKEEE